MPTAALAALLVLLAAPSANAASDASDREASRELEEELSGASTFAHRTRLTTDFAGRLTLNGMFGFGTPVGMVGGTLEYNPFSRMSLGLGVGENTVGPQLAAVSRLRPFVWNRKSRALAIEAGLSLSTGAFRGPDFGLGEPQPQEWRIDRAYWVQPELGFELQARTGFHFTVALGAAVLLNKGDLYCATADGDKRTTCDSSHSQWTMPSSLPTLTITLGVDLL